MSTHYWPSNKNVSLFRFIDQMPQGIFVAIWITNDWNVYLLRTNNKNNASIRRTLFDIYRTADIYVTRIRRKGSIDEGIVLYCHACGAYAKGK